MPHAPHADFLMPRPNESGIARTKELLLRKYGRAVTDDEAAEILRRVMRHLWLVNNPDAERPAHDSPKSGK